MILGRSSSQPTMMKAWLQPESDGFLFGLPTPPSSQTRQHDALLDTPPTSDTLVPSSPPSTISKKRKWSEVDDVILLKAAMLRQLVPEKTEVCWESIADEVIECGHQNLLTPGRVRSRFFSLMFDTARCHGISHQQLSEGLALHHSREHRTKRQRQQPPEVLEVEALADCTDSRLSSKRPALQALSAAQFNARVKQNTHAKNPNRPDMIAQRRAAECLKPKQRYAQLLREQKREPRPESLTVDQRLAQIEIPGVWSSTLARSNTPTTKLRSNDYLSQTQACRHRNSPPASIHASSAPPTSQSSASSHAVQLKSELPRELLQADEHRRQRNEQNLNATLQRADPREIYLSAVAHNAKVVTANAMGWGSGRWVKNRAKGEKGVYVLEKANSRSPDNREAKGGRRDKTGRARKRGHDSKKGGEKKGGTLDKVRKVKKCGLSDEQMAANWDSRFAKVKGTRSEGGWKI